MRWIALTLMALAAVGCAGRAPADHAGQLYMAQALVVQSQAPGRFEPVRGLTSWQLRELQRDLRSAGRRGEAMVIGRPSVLLRRGEAGAIELKEPGAEQAALVFRVSVGAEEGWYKIETLAGDAVMRAEGKLPAAGEDFAELVRLEGRPSQNFGEILALVRVEAVR